MLLFCPHPVKNKTRWRLGDDNAWLMTEAFQSVRTAELFLTSGVGLSWSVIALTLPACRSSHIFPLCPNPHQGQAALPKQEALFNRTTGNSDNRSPPKQTQQFHRVSFWGKISDQKLRYLSTVMSRCSSRITMTFDWLKSNFWCGIPVSVLPKIWSTRWGWWSSDGSNCMSSLLLSQII